MPNTKNRRPFARFNRASVTLVAGLGLAAASLALAHEGHDSVGKPVDRPVGKTDKATKPASPALGKVDAQRDRAQQTKPVAEPVAGKGRMVIGAPDDRSPGKPVVDNPFLRAPQVLNLDDENGAFQVNPVTGMGMIFSPTGTPVLLQLEPAEETLGWTGQILGDGLSSVFVLPTKWGLTAQVHSKMHGSFRLLPDGFGGSKITATNPENIGVCKVLPVDLEEADAFLRSAGTLAGAGGQCYIDTVDARDGEAAGTSFFVRRLNSNCGSQPFVETLTTDLVDESVRTKDINCQDDPGITNPPFDMIVDILVGYSGDTLAAAESEVAIRAAVALDFGYMNLCLFNSEMLFRVRCVGVEPGIGYALDGTPELYVGSGNPERDLEFLGNSTDFYRRGLENIMVDLRDERGADLVCCYVANNNTSIGGIANSVPQVISVPPPLDSPIYTLDPRSPCAILTWAGSGGGTFAHEMGHLLGAKHGNVNSTIEGTDNEACTTDETYGTPYPNVDEDAGFSLACEDNAAAGNTDCFTPNYPTEHNYGYRNWIDESEGLGFRTVMAYVADDITLIPIPFYSNPNVPIFGVDTDGAVGSFGCLCCEQGGETAANALVMQEHALNTLTGLLPDIRDDGSGFPPFGGTDTGGDGTNHFPSGARVDLDTDGDMIDDLAVGHPPQYGILQEFSASSFVIPNRAGVAQFRCRKIPYDCNQNGYLDTLEFDGVAPNGNADGLTDLDNDRVPDGCFPRECFAATSLTDPTKTAITTFEPLAPEDLYNTGDIERLFGQGGTFVDNGVYESDLRQTPVRNDVDDIYWAYEVSEIRIDGLVHPRFTDLSIELVRQNAFGDEETWTVLDCSGISGQSGVSSTLAGNYIFALNGRPDTIEDYPAATTLSGRDLCIIASSGQYPNLLPGGIYRPTIDLIEFESIPFNDRWLLRITDSNSGASGFFSGWSLKMKVLPKKEDCNLDGSPDTCFDAFAFDSDCDSNFVADSCDIASDPLTDCDMNGVLDVCEDTSFLLDLGGGLWDADGDGIVAQEAADLEVIFDDNGLPQLVSPDGIFIRQVLGCSTFDEFDESGGGFLDPLNPNTPCVPNCRQDLCDILETPQLDSNQNFILDCAEGLDSNCSSRLYRSVARGTTGEGLVLSDLSILESTIEILAEEQGADCDPVVIEGASVIGSVVVELHDLEHPRLSDLQITLVHQSASGTRVTNLLLFGCEGSGYLAGGSTTYTFKSSGFNSLCEAAQQPGAIPEGDYLPVEGSFGEHIGAGAAGSWTIQIFDGVFGEEGSLGSWDLQFVHRPPDFDDNGKPDVCEEFPCLNEP